MNKSIGIYKITNKINNKIYIGQSNNIKRRWSEHKKHFKNYNNNILLYKAFNKYGIDNFKFEILELCSEDELNNLEKYYIEFYNSCVKSKNGWGYNMTYGGNDNKHLCKEDNPNSKMTEEEIYDIRIRYKNKENKHDVYKLYKHKILFNTFCDIWIGKTWVDINMEVYTKDLLLYHKNNFDRVKLDNRTLTYEEILFIRDEYNKGELTKQEVYDSLVKDISINTFNDIWYNKTFQNIKSNIKNKRKKGIRKINQEGIKNPSSKLSTKDVLDIRFRFKNGETASNIYNYYSDKISFQCLCNVINNKTYKDIGV